MDDPWNPKPDEIRQWAYTPGAVEPCQDWDLALIWARHEKAMLECAADDACPNRRYLLNELYKMVRYAVRDGFRSMPRPVIKGTIPRGDEYPHPDIRTWQARSRELLKSPESFDYETWSSYGLASDAPRAD